MKMKKMFEMQAMTLSLSVFVLFIWGCGCPESKKHPPQAPTNLTATAGNSAVSLNWQASDGATGYNIYMGSPDCSSLAKVASTTGTNYRVTGLTNGNQYCFVVKAYNADGESSPSNQATATPVAPVPPQAPANLTAAAGFSLVTLRWDASSGATGYRIYIGSPDCSTFISTTTTTGTSVQVTGLTNGTPYCFVVRAYNAAGESENSNQATATPSASAPSAPYLAGVFLSMTSVVLTWTTITGATYNVYIGTSSGIYSFFTNTTATIFTVTGLSPGTTYYFVVTAVIAPYESAYSNERSATTLGGCNPVGPTDYLVITSASPSPGSSLTYTSSYDFSFQINYSLTSQATATIDLIIFDQNFNFLGSNSGSISQGTGTVSIPVNSVTPLITSTFILVETLVGAVSGMVDIVTYTVDSADYFRISSSTPSKGTLISTGNNNFSFTISYALSTADSISLQFEDQNFNILGTCCTTNIGPGSGTSVINTTFNVPSGTSTLFIMVIPSTAFIVDVISFPVPTINLIKDTYTVLDLPPGGNSDGLAGSGETFDLQVLLRNIGTLDATGVQANITSTFTGVTINTPGPVSLGDITSGCVGVGNFNLTIASWVPNGTIIQLTLQVSANGGSYTTTINFSIIVFKKTPGVNILLVDDDESPNNGGFWTVAEPVYMSTFTVTGYSFDFIAVPMGNPGPPASLMGQYITVVWFAGYSGSDGIAENEILTSTDQTNLMAFLNMGGKKLFLSAQFLLWDILGNDNHGASITNTFINNYLRIDSYGDYSSSSPVSGSAGTIGNGMSISLNFTAPTSLYTHTFGPTASGIECFYDSFVTPDSIGIQNSGIGTAGTSKTIFLAFPFENIVDGANPNNKATLLNMIMNY